MSSNTPDLIVDEQTIQAEEVFVMGKGYTEAGFALGRQNPSLAEALKQQAIHDTMMRRPNQHVPAAPDPKLLNYYRFHDEIDAEISRQSIAPTDRQLPTDRELDRYDLTLYFGKTSNAVAAHQLGTSNPALYRALRVKAVAAGYLAR